MPVGRRARIESGSDAVMSIQIPEQGDPWGELIQVQLALEDQTSSADQATWGCENLSFPFQNAVTYNATTPPTTFGNNFYSRFQMNTNGSQETSTTEAWSFAGYSTSISNATGPLPATSLTNDIFGSGVDPTNGVIQGAAYPPSWYRSTFNPPGVFTCTRDGAGNGAVFVFPLYSPPPPPIPATTIGPQQAIQTQD